MWLGYVVIKEGIRVVPVADLGLHHQWRQRQQGPVTALSNSSSCSCRILRVSVMDSVTGSDSIYGRTVRPRVLDAADPGSILSCVLIHLFTGSDSELDDPL